jgi:hypothetical protein
MPSVSFLHQKYDEEVISVAKELLKIILVETWRSG